MYSFLKHCIILVNYCSELKVTKCYKRSAFFVSDVSRNDPSFDHRNSEYTDSHSDNVLNCSNLDDRYMKSVPQ